MDDLLILLFGTEPLIDDLDPGAENEDQQEDGDVAGREEGLCKVPWPGLRAGNGGKRGRAAEKKAVDMRHEPIKDQQYHDHDGIGQELFPIEELRDDQVGIDIVKSYEEGIVDNKISRRVSFREDIDIARPGIEYKRQRQEAGPGGDVDDDLND